MKMDSQKQAVNHASTAQLLEQCRSTTKEDQRSFRTEFARTVAGKNGKGVIEASQETKWSGSLPHDNAFTKDVKAQFRAIFNNPGEYRRYYGC